MRTTRGRQQWRGGGRTGVTFAVLAGLLLAAGGPAGAAHGTFTVSNGSYRIPYVDGTNVNVTFDHHNHLGSSDRTDMAASVANVQVVAAAGGWIRGIVDVHGNSNGNGDGRDITGALVAGHDALEHSCQDGTPAVPNSVVTGTCAQYNNYVWIEHPNGEWSKISHFQTGSVTALHAVDDWVDAGEVLGVEGDVGRAGGRHVHFELAVTTVPGVDLTWSQNGGFIQNGTNVVPFVCDIATNLYDDAAPNYTAAPCMNQTPTADAGGPYVVEEGATVLFDALGSSDPDGTPLTFAWAPDTDLDDPSLAQPTFTGVDDALNVPYVLTVYDQTEQWPDVDAALVTVLNVEPTVTAVGAGIVEGGTATVSATFTDPGLLDTHTAGIFWGDGSSEVVTPVSLATGVDHVYGDNGAYDVTVAVLDDDGGLGIDVVQVVVANSAPVLTLDHGGEISFPGGHHQVVQTGGVVAGDAEGQDAGSDDLTFTWSTGDATTYFNDSVGPDPLPSPDGVFPFHATDATLLAAGLPGVGTLSVELSDDDGGVDGDSTSVIVTGAADATEGRGWWKHQFSGSGSPHINPATADGYREIAAAVSSIFDELVPLSDAAEAHEVLSPVAGDKRASARAELLVAWLQFASGAVGIDDVVSLNGGDSVVVLDLMFAAEALIANPASTDAELSAIARDLARMRQAG